LKGQGLGWKMMELMIKYAKHEGLQEIKGEVLAENTTMLEMCAQLGFTIKQLPHDRSMRQATLKL
jgi:acetyltransferase